MMLLSFQVTMHSMRKCPDVLIIRFNNLLVPKILKFILVIAAGGTCGAILAYFAKQIEALFWWVVLLGVLGGIGYWIWNII
mgnify:CR=1 FL=1